MPLQRIPRRIAAMEARAFCLRPLFLGVDLFKLKRFHEALTLGVIPRICEAAHACDDLVLVQDFAVFTRRIWIPRSESAGCQSEGGMAARNFPTAPQPHAPTPEYVPP